MSQPDARREEFIETQALVAMLFVAAYLVVFLVRPPQVPIKSVHFGKMYGGVPMVSFFLILFPHFNDKMPVPVTRLFVLIGLVSSAVILLVSKVLIW